jgi:mono/diheme cytochrome c family protein
MVNKYLPAFFFYFFLGYTYAQEVNYEQHIAPILQTNCVSCHRSGGYGPFPLTTYSDIQKRGKFIAYVTKTKYMPPWKADPAFSHFKNERILTDQEINQIQLWVGKE